MNMGDASRLDMDKIDEVALALLAFGRHKDGSVTRMWKGLDWDIMNRLHENGWIADPKSKAKSVILTEEGERLAEEFVEKHFAMSD
jgi:predicted transcriptional regulator